MFMMISQHMFLARRSNRLCASLVLFLYTFLKIARWHSWIRMFWLADDPA